MGPTSIDVDDELVARVMGKFGLRTKREAVNLALRRLVGPVLTREEMLRLEGTGWHGDLTELRAETDLEVIDLR